jgi:hypothetical protein
MSATAERRPFAVNFPPLGARIVVRVSIGNMK